MILFLGMACVGPATGQPVSAAAPAGAPTPEVYRRLATEAEGNLEREVLARWFPAAVDKDAGGFVENFAEDWSRRPGGERHVVYQSRLTWLAARAAQRDKARSSEYLTFTRHGAAALSGKLWDAQHGGFFWAVDEQGRPARERGGEKHAYGVAFGIFASAASHAATGDPASLDLARRAFRWIDEHAHDAEHGGYYEALSPEGKPLLAPPGGGGGGAQNDAIGTAYGRKSMNTHIHLLEAFVALQAVAPDPAVRARLSELHDLILSKFYAEPGILHLYVTPDWKPVPGVDSFGHDIETAFLLAESAEALGKPDDEATWRAGRRLVDHALDVGFDPERGGFYNEGTADGHELDKRKIWWVQAEGLNALLLMHERFGRETPRYWEAFLRQWSFITKHQIDARHGGWHATVNADGTPIPGRAKSDRWTEGYHQGRSMMTVAERLRRLAGDKGH